MWNALNFQNGASPMMEQLIFFSDYIMIPVTSILTFTGWILISTLKNSLVSRSPTVSHFLEIVWTLLPMMILVAIALPSLRLLYLLDEIKYPDLTVKIMGHQWYWSYEFPDFQEVVFDSFMIPETDLQMGQLRLLEVDNRLVLPLNTHIRLLVSSTDVIHSWSVPSLGIKLDAIPGRLNQAPLFMNRPGVFYGQCSEICGAFHSFMPIVVESVPLLNFNSWILDSK